MVNEVLAEGGSLGALRPGGELGMVGGKEKRGGEGPRTRERGIEASRVRFASLRMLACPIRAATLSGLPPLPPPDPACRLHWGIRDNTNLTRT